MAALPELICVQFACETTILFNHNNPSLNLTQGQLPEAASQSCHSIGQDDTRSNPIGSNNDVFVAIQ